VLLGEWSPPKDLTCDGEAGDCATSNSEISTCVTLLPGTSGEDDTDSARAQTIASETMGGAEDSTNVDESQRKKERTTSMDTAQAVLQTFAHMRDVFARSRENGEFEVQAKAVKVDAASQPAIKGLAPISVPNETAAELETSKSTELKAMLEASEALANQHQEAERAAKEQLRSAEQREQSQRAKASQLNQDVERLAQDVDRLKQELQSASDDLAAASGDAILVKELRSREVKLEGDLNSVRLKHSQNELKVAELEAAREQAQHQVDSLKLEKHLIEVDLERAKAEISTANSRHRSLEEELRVLKQKPPVAAYSAGPPRNYDAGVARSPSGPAVTASQPSVAPQRQTVSWLSCCSNIVKQPPKEG